MWQLQELKKNRALLDAQREKIKTDDLRLLWQQIHQLTLQTAKEHQELEACEKICRAHERELAGIAGQIKDTETKLYGGKVTNLKELEQIKLRYDAERREIADREEVILEKMGRCENLSQSIAEHETMLASLKKRHKQKQLETAQAIHEIDTAVEELERDLAGLLVAIRPDILSRYNELSRKMALPVAKVLQGICGGCHRSLPTGRIKAKQTELLYCDNCGRILIC